MKSVSVQKIAKILNVLVSIALVCNLLALFFVPLVVAVGKTGMPNRFRVHANGGLYLDAESHMVLAYILGSVKIWMIGWWRVFSVYQSMLTVFLLLTGCCTAVILWQARRVLASILGGHPFSMENAVSLRRAAAFCFLIAGAALVRVVFSVIYYRSPGPIASYNALFVPMFAMAGLLCLVMSALFRQAAELKAENDLTI